MTDQALINRPDSLDFSGVQGARIFTGNGGKGIGFPLKQGQEPVERLVHGLLTEKGGMNGIFFHHMLTETDKSRIGVTLTATYCFCSGIMPIKRGKAQLVFPLIVRHIFLF